MSTYPGVNLQALCRNSVLNVKMLQGAFNQEKALVGAFSVIRNLRMELFEALVPSVEPRERKQPSQITILVWCRGRGW